MRKSLTTLSLILLLLISMTSCKTNFYQVYTVETEEAEQVDNSLVFENNDCKVYYNLWSNNGKLSFVFLNKTDKDIFINLGQTFFIKNGFAIDYYQGRTYTDQTYVQTSSSISFGNTKLKGNGYWSNNIYKEDVSVFENGRSIKNVNARANAVTIKEKEIVCIPAKCYKMFSYYSANPLRYITCDNNKDYPKDFVNVADFNKQNSPLIFSNRIAYGFNKDAVAEKHMDNNFWISSIMNYSQNSATEEVDEKDDCDKKDKDSYDFNQKKIRQFKIGGPNKFYQSYVKK